MVVGMLFEHKRVVQLIEISLFSLYTCILKFLQLVVQGKEGNNDSPLVRQNQRFLKAQCGGADFFMSANTYFNFYVDQLIQA